MGRLVELQIPPRSDHLALVRLVVEGAVRLGGALPDSRVDDLRLAVSEADDLNLVGAVSAITEYSPSITWAREIKNINKSLLTPSVIDTIVQRVNDNEITNSKDIRDGITGTVEWEPSDSIHSVLDLYYSRFKQTTTNRGTEFFSSAWVDNVTYSNVQTETRDGVTFDVADHVTNVAPILRWNDNKRVDHLFSAGLNNEFKLAEGTKLLADLSYSSNKRDEKDIEIFGGYGCCGRLSFDAEPPAPDNVFQDGRVFDSYDRVIPSNGFLQDSNFGLDYADASQVSLGDRSTWGGYGSEGHIKSPRIKETLASGDLTLQQDLRGSDFGNVFSNDTVSDGVGCEACHGGSGGWLASHRSVAGTLFGNAAPASRTARQASGWLQLHGVTRNNLRDLDVAFPLGCMTAVTGVSGGGKSSLVSQALVDRQRWVAYELLSDHPGGLDQLGVEEVERLGEGMADWGSVDAFGCNVSGPAWRQGQPPPTRPCRTGCRLG